MGTHTPEEALWEAQGQDAASRRLTLCHRQSPTARLRTSEPTPFLAASDQCGVAAAMWGHKPIGGAAMAACTMLQGAEVTTRRGSHPIACITPLTPPNPTCPPHPTNQYRRLKWYSGVLHDEDFTTQFFALLLSL